MPLRTASNLTFFYALGYPIGALAVSAMSPMAVLVFRFGLAGAILSCWAVIARVTWPTGRTLVHVLVSGLLTLALQFICLYLALLHGACSAGRGSVGGFNQQRFCSGVDFRATAALQNAVAVLPVAALAMLFAVIPAVAGLLSWLMLVQRPDIGIAVGLVVGAAACWLNARGSRQQRQHDPAGDGRGQHRVDPIHDAAVPR
jgi:drug/metabolite transporter (DMT)-like permease